MALSWVGLVLTTAGLVFAALAQQGMGRSWRIGVDPSENTELVTGGLFALARNPIFTGMIAAQAGTVLLAPTGLGLVGAILLLLACELQVRKVEEPYLVRTHGRSYASSRAWSVDSCPVSADVTTGRTGAARSGAPMTGGHGHSHGPAGHRDRAAPQAVDSGGRHHRRRVRR